MKDKTTVTVFRVGGALIITLGLGIAIGSLYFMLYCGIMQAVDNWGTNNSTVVWGIIRAIMTSAVSGIGVFIASLGAAAFAATLD